MPNLLDPNVCIPLVAVILLIIGVFVRLSPQGQAQHKRDEEKAKARDAELDRIYGRHDGL